MRSVLDASRLWKAAKLPPLVPLSEGLRRTVEWMRSVAVR
jgi:nucleoside-diphosphate-sugar epimerase